jgi:transcriptional regulator with XRE-family HTH domain
MKALNERIKNYRNQLHLSQEYVANYLGVNRATVTQMELGKRKVSADELSKLSTLFGVTTDTLLHDDSVSQPATLFARSFESLDENDQAEIMNLIRFKEMMKAQRDK